MTRHDNLPVLKISLSILEGLSLKKLEHQELVTEYYCLSVKPELSDQEADRFRQLLDLAIENESFAELISRVDKLACQKLKIKPIEENYNFHLLRAIDLINEELNKNEISVDIKTSTEEQKNSQEMLYCHLKEAEIFKELDHLEFAYKDATLEYYRLSIQSELIEEEEINKFSELLALAEEDSQFSELINRVDELTCQKLGIEISQDSCEIQLEEARRQIEPETVLPGQDYDAELYPKQAWGNHWQFNSAQHNYAIDQTNPHTSSAKNLCDNSFERRPRGNGVKTILLLTVDPRHDSQRRLDVEVREIKDGIVRGEDCKFFHIEQELASTPGDLRRAMLAFNPLIVHFCGYGHSSQGIALEHESEGIHLVSGDALSRLFKLFADQVECVVLSACYSETQAQAIGKHIPYVIGMNQHISHEATTQFSIGFYDALSAGESYETAFLFGQNAIQLNNILEDSTPVLVSLKPDVPTVLILEDNEMWLARHERRLQEAGFRCHSTQFAEEAIDIAKVDSSVKFALIDEVLFVPPIPVDSAYRQLQRWQGSGVIRELGPLRPDIKFIVVTSTPQLKSKGDSQSFRHQTYKLRSLPGVVDVIHQQDIDENPDDLYLRLIQHLRS